MSLFDNGDEYYREFASGLKPVLDSGDLGAFILALSNSLQNTASHQALIAPIRDRYQSFYEQKSIVDAAPDDIRVFERLCGMDIDEVPLWQWQTSGHWLLLLNPMRSLRPPRTSAEKVDSILRPFDDALFNFNREFLKTELFFRQQVNGREVSVFYNKFPFMPYHVLLVPEPERCHNQYLTEEMHHYIWELTQLANENVSGTGFGYNSIGACASVNHLHFQGFQMDRSLPVERGYWTHNGGMQDYPVEVELFDDPGEGWARIVELNEADQPYNLLYREDYCYLFVRRWQGDDAINDAVSGAGWSELSGVLSVADEKELFGYAGVQIEADLSSLQARNI